jgi:hypothetical protein
MLQEKRCRKCQKSTMGSAVAIVNEPVFKVSTFVNLNKSTSKYENLLAMECFHQNALKSLEF